MRESYDVPLDFMPKTASEWHLCLNNFEWYASRFIYIADKDSPDGPHPIFLNRAQRRILSLMKKYQNSTGGVSCIALKGRQMGGSTLFSARLAWNAFRAPYFKAMQIANESKSVGNLLRMVKFAYEKLPDYYPLQNGIKQAVKMGEKTSNRNELIVYHNNDTSQESQIVIEEASAKEEAGISFALNELHLSECGKDEFDDGKAVYAATQTLSKNGIKVAESTANGAYGWFYDTFQNAEDEFREFKKAHNKKPSLIYDGWVPVFLPWFWHYRLPLFDGEIIEPLDQREEALMNGDITYQHHKCTPEEIKGRRWLLKNRIDDIPGMTREQVERQEYPANPDEAFLVSGSGYFNEQVIEHGLAFSREFIKNCQDHRRYSFNGTSLISDNRGAWQFIKHPEPEKYKYIIGGDVAEGLEHGDYDTCGVIEVRAGEPNVLIAIWRDKEDDKYTHAKNIVCVRNMTQASETAIERNFHGASVNDFLERLNCKNLYVQTPKDEGSWQPGHTKKYGFLTGRTTRGMMLGELSASLLKWHMGEASDEYEDGLIIPFPEVWNELRTFVKIRKKAEAAPGAHDDLVFAVGIANFVAFDVTPKRSKPQKRAGTFTILDELRMNGMVNTPLYKLLKREQKRARKNG